MDLPPASRPAFRRAVLTCLVAGTIICSPLTGQAARLPQFEITPFGGWFLSGNITLSTSTTFPQGGTLLVDNAVGYGLALTLRVERDLQVELSYTRATSSMRYENAAGVVSDVTDLATNYYQIGGLYLLRGKSVRPFLLYTLGAGQFDPVGDRQSKWLFSMAFGFGIKFYITESFGIRTQARLFLPIDVEGGSLYFGTGGAGYAVGATVPAIQSDLTLGLMYTIP